MLESAGIHCLARPYLSVASIQAASHHQLNIFMVAAVAIFAAIAGDNMGYAAGRYGGRPLFDRYRTTLHIEDSTVQRGEQLFAKHGSVTVFSPASSPDCAFLPGRSRGCCV